MLLGQDHEALPDGIVQRAPNVRARLATVHGLWVIEDAAEALGSIYNGRRAGSISTTWRG
jgi:dTDP-4-amino-4,6-dideoxygalactose transaminase